MLNVHDRKSFTVYLALAVAVVAAINFIARDLFFRVDLTDNRIYSLSESSKQVVGKIADRLTMKVYFTQNLPGEYGNNRRYLQDILEEYEAYAGGKVRFEFYQPEDDENLAADARRYGIQPVQLQVIENDKLEVKRVFMGMVFLYGDEREALPIIESTTGLEYEITTRIKRLVDRDRKTLAFVDTGGGGAERTVLTRQLQQSYNVRTTSLGNEIPAHYRLLLMGGVEDSLSAEELGHLKAFLGRGGNLFVAQSRVTGDLQGQQGEVIRSNIFDFLADLGLVLKENLVLDATCSAITVTQNQGFLRFNTRMQYPFFPLIRNFGDHLTVNGLEQVGMLYTSEIDTSRADSTGRSHLTPLLFTSNRSGTAVGLFNVTPFDNPYFEALVQPPKVVGALATVDWDTSATVSQVALVGDSRFFEDTGAGGFPENGIFVANVVDFLMGDQDLVALRSREITTRPLRELEDAEKAQWKWLNILLPSLLIVGYGLVRWRGEIRRAKAVEEQYG